MNRYFVLSFLLVIFVSLSLNSQGISYKPTNESYDLNWEKPDLRSQTHQSILYEHSEEFNYFEAVNDSSYFALTNSSTFKNAVVKLFTEKRNNSRFYFRKKQFPNYFDEKPLTTKLEVKLYCGNDFAGNDEDRYFFPYYGFNLNGYLTRRFLFYADFWSGHYFGDRDFAEQAELINSWTQNSDDGKQIFLDNARGKMLYYPMDFWSVAIGRGKYEIGNNIGGSIILSDNCVDYGYFSTKFDFEKFYVHFLHGSLIADSTLTGEKDYPDKYLATHKFGWKPSQKLELFWGEHVVYGAQAINPSYLIPFTYWRGTEHNLSDRDNVLIYFGTNYTSNKSLFYFNYIFDELSFSKLTESSWMNKYAIQTGISTYLSDTIRLTGEFTAVRPWIYTHESLHGKFSNYGRSLGFPDGTNLIQYAMECSWNIKDNLNIVTHASYTRQGSVGNNFAINYNDRPSDTVHWLEGSITDTAKTILIVDWQPLSHHRFRTSLISTRIAENDIEHELMLSYQVQY
ncbi:MAG: hypothetical protein K9N09_00025 [Candidatus Cloacimonetes bacterium]|nr:hypothetical protein [Candidatus Cloacimonadota bacterium]MCF7812848.1 hypothetical protein [Candidatus Cloacimonadota bacterium]MCF7867060.1 hypothetical protein [Candidatus Cloacimonadota bacterium]MCF7882620.1 hypothetical protein [Candidatus Cloacimonadota bacterium]